MDNLSARKGAKLRAWAKKHLVELCFTPASASWADPIEAHFGSLQAEDAHVFPAPAPSGEVIRLCWGRARESPQLGELFSHVAVFAQCRAVDADDRDVRCFRIAQADLTGVPPPGRQRFDLGHALAEDDGRREQQRAHVHRLQ
jgi:hypothetical protein